ncbi:hypothetical protein TrRE_jg9728 [Triparma retinervis]|uniref:GRIP domain-containing protein n=1 Tax=Triparma retinervis TaxID=2557542 RepID=A0A9W7A481_9STRA|nr:hypothetical protein TrRE_jg9728 [Triparma retinervis]
MTAAAKSHAALTSEHAGLSETHGRLREAHKILKSKAGKVVNELKETRAKLESAVEGKAKGNVDYMEMQNTCKALKERNANLQRENEDSATTISKMSSDLTVLREAAKRTKAESEVMGRDAQDELKTYKEKALKALQQSNERVAELTRENASLKEFNEGYKRDAEDARDEKDKVEMTADTLRSEISTLTTSQSAIKTKLNSLTSKTESADAEVAELKSELDKVTVEKKMVEDENDRLSKIVKTSQSTVELAENDKRGLEEKLRALEKELKTKNASITTTSSSLPAPPPTNTTASTSPPSHSPSPSPPPPPTSEPLIYALSKASELSIATSEITRLSSLLADVSDDLSVEKEKGTELEKALENAKMEIERKERMGGGDDNVNVEYLKNVLLQYLTSPAVTEKKRLLPVLATVLSLTPSERLKAERSLESNKGIRGVGEVLIEGVEGVKEEGIVKGVLGFVGLRR